MNKQSRIQSRNKGIKSVVFIGIFTTLSIYLWRLLSKEENHIHIPHPHSLPTSFHPHRFLPLINAFLVVDGFDEGSRGHRCCQLTDTEG